MDVHFNHRAMIAIRSLDPVQRHRVDAVVEDLGRATASDWRTAVQVKVLQAVGKEQFFSVRVDDELRFVAKIIADALFVEDVFARERLEQIAGMAV